MRPRMLILLALLALASCAPGVLAPEGPIGATEKAILVDSLAIMLAIVAPTIVATLAFAWWFRASNSRATHRPTWAFSGRIEMIVWSIPAMVIILLGGVAWISAHALAPERPIRQSAAPLQVQVVSLDWKWLFIYPQLNRASVNELTLPQGRAISFELTSASVMNSFFIPQLGSMIYTMNGMATHLNLLADKPGIYRGLSAHFSGDGFSDMHFVVRVLSPPDYAAWQAAPTGANLDEAAYAQLERQGTVPAPLPFRAVDPKLFAGIVSRRVSPAPGP